MIREIKFRAWDKKNKKILQTEDIATIDFESRCIWIKEKLKSGYWLYFKDADILQYTGLKDKSCVEIYEGDILAFHRAGYPNKPRFLVEFKNGGFHLQSLHSEYDDEFMSEMEMEYAEVVGNQYQNP